MNQSDNNGIQILTEIYDYDLNLLQTFTTCRYFKVVKNTLNISKKPYYNQYQFVIEIPSIERNLIQNNRIFKITMTGNKGTVFITYIKSTDIQILKETTTTILYNIIGISWNVYRFLTEDILSRISDYDQVFRAFNVPRTPFSTSIFSLLNDGIFKIMDVLYGPFIMENQIDNSLINRTSLTIQNLPLMKNPEIIKYFFNNLHPILDLPFFGIDDFIARDQGFNKDKYTGSLIINSYQNILKDKRNLISELTYFRPIGINIKQEINTIDLKKNAYGDYIIHNVDHPSIQIGPGFVLPRIFGTSIQTDELQSIYTVNFDYAIDELILSTFRANYKKLENLNLTTYEIGFSNVTPEFLNINRLFEFDGSFYYVYGNEFEFVPLNDGNSKTLKFKIDGKIKTLLYDLKEN